MASILKSFFKTQAELTIVFILLLVLNLILISSLIYYNHNKQINVTASTLHKITKYYFDEEQKKSFKIIDELKKYHIKFTKEVLDNKIKTLDKLIFKFQAIIEKEFHNNTSVAVINKDLIIKNTTLKSEQNLDLKQFEDAVLVSKKLLEKRNPYIVFVNAPIFNIATKTFKIYTMNYIPKYKIFLQIGLSTNYLKDFNKIVLNNLDYEAHLLYAEGIKKLTVYDIEKGVRTNDQLDLKHTIEQEKYIIDSLRLKKFYYKILKYKYLNDNVNAFIVLKIKINKIPIYEKIASIVIIESLIFIILFYYFRRKLFQYNKNLFYPFKYLVLNIKRGLFINNTDKFEFKELKILANSYNKNLKELKNKQKELENALEEIKSLKEFIPICSSCKKIKDEHGNWHSLETYMSDNHQIDFSHGLCPECIEKLYPEYSDKILKKSAK